MNDESEDDTRGKIKKLLQKEITLRSNETEAYLKKKTLEN